MTECVNRVCIKVAMTIHTTYMYSQHTVYTHIHITIIIAVYKSVCWGCAVDVSRYVITYV